MNNFLIAPSILSADFANLEKEIRSLESAGADWIHVDVMDGHFVPNLTIGPPVVKSLRPVTKLPLDVHLMIDKPENYIRDFVQSGADYITIHVEATNDPIAVFKKIKDLGCKSGISLKPGTDVKAIFPFLSFVDLVLVMTVEPGFGGQSFMHEQVDKIRLIREELNRIKHQAFIEVDGGINPQTAKECYGADVLVAGSYIFKNNYKEAINLLKGIK